MRAVGDSVPDIYWRGIPIENFRKHLEDAYMLYYCLGMTLLQVIADGLGLPRETFTSMVDDVQKMQGEVLRCSETHF